MKNSKFTALYEAAMTRYQRGGFLVGDTIKFNDSFKTTDAYKKLGTNVQEMIDQMIASGLNVRITDIKNKYPSSEFSNPETSTGDVYLDIALDAGGGRYTHLVTIPSGLAQPVDFYPNLTPVPDAFKRANKIQIDPEELTPDSDNISRQTDRGTGKYSPTELELPVKNISIPAKAASNSMEVTASGMHDYLKGLGA